jgi:hypothetical protein
VFYLVEPPASTVICFLGDKPSQQKYRNSAETGLKEGQHSDPDAVKASKSVFLSRQSLNASTEVGQQSWKLMLNTREK